MIILGIDPGSIVLGYGAITSMNSNPELIEYGVIHPSLKQKDFNLRLLEIFNNLQKIVKRTSPKVIVIEKTFYHKNAQSLIKLSQTKAIAVLVALLNNIPVVEYSPREVKKLITGRGNASKQQVQFFVRNILKIEEKPEFYDATDALSIALCHFYQNSSNSSNDPKKVRSWTEFVQQNAHRIVEI